MAVESRRQQFRRETQSSITTTEEEEIMLAEAAVRVPCETAADADPVREAISGVSADHCYAGMDTRADTV